MQNFKDKNDKKNTEFIIDPFIATKIKRQKVFKAKNEIRRCLLQQIDEILKKSG